MPTGVALRDPRQQLFEAAERVLDRRGPRALTSRAVTIEAGCAKGVLHRHFVDFDDFLVELVMDRRQRIAGLADALGRAAGSGTVTDNLADALVDLFGSVALGILGLVMYRDDLRARLRRVTPEGVPLLTEATAMVAGYLAGERACGRVAAGADLDVLAPTLVGAAHLLFVGCDGRRPELAEVRRAVTAVLGGVVTC